MWSGKQEVSSAQYLMAWQHIYTTKELGGLGTNDLVSWVHNRGMHRGCLSEVDVWVSDGSGTQKHKRDTVIYPSSVF